MSGSAAGIFAEGETDHYFKFSLGSSSSLLDVMKHLFDESRWMQPISDGDYRSSEWDYT